ncbi:helix-turn-helix domain-containing protein [Nonomuraea insulae]|uniref:Transposase n=1 Tax=Nonomuraea insulae TaxID=1616787 RepID=A0ABW1CZA3_9ACTN
MEGRKLQRITRTAKDPVKLRRAVVVMMSGQGQSVPDITSLMQVGDDYVRDVIHAFNERGFDALDPKWSGGRPRVASERVCEHICLIARTVPAEWGIIGHSTCSLRMIAALDLATGKLYYRIRKRKRYALNGTDHRTQDEQNAAIGGYVRWRTARAQPKTSFAASSPIRSWSSYPAKVA